MNEFDVGYQHGAAVVILRSPHDLKEVWLNVLKGTKVVVWCSYGLKMQRQIRDENSGICNASLYVQIRKRTLPLQIEYNGEPGSYPPAKICSVCSRHPGGFAGKFKIFLRMLRMFFDNQPENRCTIN